MDEGILVSGARDPYSQLVALLISSSSDNNISLDPVEIVQMAVEWNARRDRLIRLSDCVSCYVSGVFLSW